MSEYFFPKIWFLDHFYCMVLFFIYVVFKEICKRANDWRWLFTYTSNNSSWFETTKLIGFSWRTYQIGGLWFSENIWFWNEVNIRGTYDISSKVIRIIKMKFLTKFIGRYIMVPCPRSVVESTLQQCGRYLELRMYYCWIVLSPSFVSWDIRT